MKRDIQKRHTYIQRNTFHTEKLLSLYNTETYMRMCVSFDKAPFCRLLHRSLLKLKLRLCTYILKSACRSFHSWKVGACMGWLRWVGCLKIQVSLQNTGLFCRALLQKRPIFLSILLIVATPYVNQTQPSLHDYSNVSFYIYRPLYIPFLGLFKVSFRF